MDQGFKLIKYIRGNWDKQLRLVSRATDGDCHAERTMCLSVNQNAKQ